jgi:Rrf2 family protein
MRLGQTTKYAFQTLAYLIRSHARDEWGNISDISATYNIPRKYLEQVLLEMKNAGILISKKGQHGGYKLARSPDEITLGQVVASVQGELMPIPTWLEDSDSGLSTDSGLSDVVKQANFAVQKIFDSTSIEVLVCKPENWLG